MGRAAPYSKKAKTIPTTVMTPGLNIFSKALTDSYIFCMEPKKVYNINNAIDSIEFHIDNREKWIDLQRKYSLKYNFKNECDCLMTGSKHREQ